MYAQLWNWAPAAPGTVGEKRAGNLNELLWFWQRDLYKRREKKKPLYISCQHRFFTLWLFLLHFLFFTQRSADVRYAWASSYFQNWNNVAALLLFSFQHAVLHALSSAGSKSPALTLTFRWSHIYLWHSPTRYRIICAFLFVWYPPLHTPPDPPSLPFFQT